MTHALVCHRIKAVTPIHKKITSVLKSFSKSIAGYRLVIPNDTIPFFHYYRQIMKAIFLLPVFLFLSSFLFAQDMVFQTFKDRRVINVHSVDMLPAQKLDFRVSHRFGDMGDGWESFYGLETASDVLIGFEYGLTDDLNIGAYRTKGAGPLTQLLNGSLKYRLLSQKTDNSMPLSLTALAVASASTMSKSDDEQALNRFDKTAHRLSYTWQIILARKFSDYFSLQLAPGYTHRNLVAANDENGIFSLSGAFRLQLTKVFGLIADVNLPFSSLRTSENNYYPALGLGLEVETGGHVFQINFTNARAIIANDYIPKTRSDWTEGEFRLGFTISRMFNL
jgi:hypothetical protein